MYFKCDLAVSGKIDQLKHFFDGELQRNNTQVL